MPPKGAVGIRHHTKGEWLFAGNRHMDKNRRRALTWKRKDLDPAHDDDMRWEIVDFGEYVGFRLSTQTSVDT